MRRTLRQRIWEIVEQGKSGDRLSKVFDFFIISLIVLSTAAIILESVDEIGGRMEFAFNTFEYICVAIFAIEYLLRVWSCTADKKFASPVTGRIRFMFQPLCVIDLMAILPSLLLAVGLDLRFLRMLRVFRIFRLAKLVRYSASLQLLARVLKRSWRSLFVTLFAIGVLMVLASCMMYLAENDANPKDFPDIPSTMWWAVITITTVGYGDAIPISVAGRVLTAVIAMLGVGVLALPTAIIGAAFVEELTLHGKARKCPHCGGEIH